MILDKSLRPKTPVDEPPAYDGGSSTSTNAASSLDPWATPSSTTSYFPDAKSRLDPFSESIDDHPTAPIAVMVKPTPPPSPSGKTSTGWMSQLIGTPKYKQDEEVRQTVLALLRGVIQKGEGQNSATTIDIIQCCIAACSARGMSFDKIAQERSIQGHTPLYWSIVKITSGSSSLPQAQNSLAPPSNPSGTDFIPVFNLLVALPLTPDGYADAIQACIMTSSHAMLERLQPHSPTPALHIPGEEDTHGRDIVTVVNAEDTEGSIAGAFRMQALVKDFQRRLRVLNEVKVDFIACGRMWSIKFFVWSPSLKNSPESRIPGVRHGAWVVMLELVENSHDTWLNSRLAIGQPEAKSASDSTVSQTPIVLWMASSGQNQLSGDEVQKYRYASRGPIYRALSDHPQASSLQFDGCPYIREDGSLDLFLDAKLVQPEENRPSPWAMPPAIASLMSAMSK
ncbi:hypothetical protein FRB95_008268 [Tulasnella sp. JGI-2019a]|nr:hypothetical protein FRB95_008268 [Tulasnella sp. JGI-2019a]